MTTKPDLDTLLAAPLAPVNDNGFSRSVVAKISLRERFWMGTEIAAALAAFASVVAFTPAAGIVGPLDKAVFDLGTSMPFAIACAALVLTLTFARQIAE